MTQNIHNPIRQPYVSEADKIKARMVAAITPDMHPELRDLINNLRSDAATVRETITQAFQESWFDGMDALATACFAVVSIPMRQRLVAVMGKLGRYEALELLARWELEFLARRAGVEVVQKAAVQALASMRRNKRWPASDLSPEFMTRVTRRICSLIESATTGQGAENDKSLDSSSSAEESSPSRKRRKKAPRAKRASPVANPSA